MFSRNASHITQKPVFQFRRNEIVPVFCAEDIVDIAANIRVCRDDTPLLIQIQSTIEFQSSLTGLFHFFNLCYPEYSGLFPNVPTGI